MTDIPLLRHLNFCSSECLDFGISAKTFYFCPLKCLDFGIILEHVWLHKIKNKKPTHFQYHRHHASDFYPSEFFFFIHTMVLFSKYFSSQWYFTKEDFALKASMIIMMMVIVMATVHLSNCPLSTIRHSMLRVYIQQTTQHVCIYQNNAKRKKYMKIQFWFKYMYIETYQCSMYAFGDL